MRYIVDESGYLKEVSFGAIIVCGGQECSAYTGGVPDGYSSLADWYSQENEKLHRWKIVGGELTLDSDAVDPEMEWANPPMLEGVEYRTTERWNGKPVYRKIVTHSHTGQVGNSTGYYELLVPHGITGLTHTISCKGSVGPWGGLLPYVADGGGITTVTSVDETEICLKFYKDVFNNPTFYFDLAYVKE